MKSLHKMIFLMIAILLLLTGCTSKATLEAELAETNQKMNQMEERIKELEQQMSASKTADQE